MTTQEQEEKAARARVAAVQAPDPPGTPGAPGQEVLTESGTDSYGTPYQVMDDPDPYDETPGVIVDAPDLPLVFTPQGAELFAKRILQAAARCRFRAKHRETCSRCRSGPA